MSEFVTQCIAALAENSHYPTFSEAHSSPTLATAYEAQAEFVEARGETIAGYKAAVTAPQAQQAMGIDTPVMGVLLASTAQGLSLPCPAGGILETELGYTLTENITSPVTAAEIQSMLSPPICVVEVAVPNLAGRPTGPDLVATNTATWGYLKGESLQTDDIDAVQTALSGNDGELFSGISGQVLAGQMDSASWLVNQALALGYPILAGHFLMTGSIGGVAPTVVGDYVASYTSTTGSSEIQFSLT